jgi:c(7)-type cytochrome triheme protein
MYSSYGDMRCTTCHNGLKATSQAAPPKLSGENLTMGRGISCGTCHNGKKEFAIFVAKMQPAKATATTPAGPEIGYGRCGDCHTIVSGHDGGGDGREGGDGGGDRH